MKRIFIALIVMAGIEFATAETVRVTVGNVGCPGRQIGVSDSWKKIPDVISVTLLPQQPTDVATQRVFEIVAKSTAPSENSLREALGRRVKYYPILGYKNEQSH